MHDQTNLRPLEAVILRLESEGHAVPDIAKRIGKKPGTVHRILQMIEHKADIPDQSSPTMAEGRQVERVISRLRDQGESYGEIGNRLNKSGRQVKKIEGFAELR
jgi:DNA-binding CsgD family transcriptional regulator